MGGWQTCLWDLLLSIYTVIGKIKFEIIMTNNSKGKRSHTICSQNLISDICKIVN